MAFLLRKRSPSPVSRDPASRSEEILDALVDRDEVIDRFDASYLDDIAELLRELHGVTGDNLADHPLRPQLEELWESAGGDGALSLERLGEVLKASDEVDEERYSPQQAPEKIKKKYAHTRVPIWKRAAGLRASSNGEAREVINELQSEYSVQSGGDRETEFTDLARPETGDPWSGLLVELREKGVIRADEPVLTIGPRWLGEIHYFRDKLGLKGTIGLDLFSNDPELITVGDMHDMPFEDNTFGLVYQRNTFDKSYDIRAALRECRRVLRDGGVLVSDDCYAYTDGVSEVSRTSIKHNNQVVRVLEPNVAEVIYDRETDSQEDWIERVGQIAVRISK